jgi:ubiquinone/menaquinone biosynthesis C-methylase UbiE
LFDEDVRFSLSKEAAFYDEVYRSNRYASFANVEQHFAGAQLTRFVDEYSIAGRRCLEVGSGRGVFQDVVDDYTGVDLSDSVASCYRKPFVAASAEELPFTDSNFDVVWSITVLEHIPNPEQSLREMRRVLKGDGLLYLQPAWNCRSWICEGIPVRPYSTLSLRQKLIKFTLPVRDSLLFRAAFALPRRLLRSVVGLFTRTEHLEFKKLPADYSTFWMVDSDACSSIDPFDAIQWFKSQGDLVLSHPRWLDAFLSRSEPLVVQIRK